MQLFEIDQISHSQITSDLQEMAHFLMLEALKNPSQLIDNVVTDLKGTVVNGSILPVTVNEQAYHTTHVCSMYTTLVSYGRQELRHIDNKIARALSLAFVASLDHFLKAAKIDRIVSNNNFFLATSLYPALALKEQQLIQYIHKTAQQFGKHAIVFKSLNFHTNAQLMQTLKNAGCQLMPFREIFIFDPKLKDYTTQRHYKVDLNILKNNKNYSLGNESEITENDYDRMSTLYRKLYIDKHSIYNPQFNRHYIQASHKNGFIKYFGLRNASGLLDGFIGFYDRHNVTTTPIVGYDTSLPQELGLYRMLMAYAISRAHKQGLILNLSSGASQFKLRRGGVSFIEYQAVYTKHLKNQFQKLTWHLLKGVLSHIGIPLMKKFL